MKLSVCMATYNGEKFLKEQLTSILTQLKNSDELIISDDSSTDTTIKIINSYNDKRIKLYKNELFKSPIFNFENAIKHATGDIIVLSDQDDIWEPNKLEVIQKEFNKDSSTIRFMMYNGVCIDENQKIINKNLFDYLDVHEGLIKNIIKNSFIGCNIAFTKNLLPIALPFPSDTPMHDMWLGSCAYLYGDVKFIDKKIFQYRLHQNNYTGKKSSLIQKIKWRIQLIKNLIVRYLYVRYYS